ncbi:MAG: hypothetical protein AB1817_17930 [Chloroflexota bacterium]
MKDWFVYLNRGLARQRPLDWLTDARSDVNPRARPQNLRPFAARHWRKGALGALLVFVNALLGFSDPLIYRFAGGEPDAQ